MIFRIVGTGLMLAGVLSTLASCRSSQSSPQAMSSAINDNAQNMQVRYQVVSNTDTPNCQPSRAGGDCYLSQLRLRFSQALPATGWSIYFSHLAPIQKLDNDHFDISHINGDLHKLVPTTAIEANRDYLLELQSDFWMVTQSDVLPDYFFVYDQDQTALIAATKEQISPITGLSVLPHAGSFEKPQHIKRNASDAYNAQTAQSIFARNKQIIQDAQSVEVSKQQALLVPRASKAQFSDGLLDVQSGFAVNVAPSFDRVRLQYQAASLGLALSQDGVATQVILDAEIAEQGYRLSIHQQGIEIAAGDEAGAYYGLVSLAQLTQKQSKLELTEITDSPRYTVRSVHIDVARNFRSAEFIKTLIGQMSRLKLNTLHLHLADDEGWRLEIDGLAELTEIGAYRCFDPSESECLLPQLGSGPERQSTANGYYSAEQYIDILRTAQQHHVQVIPSLDMPGHSRAAIVSMLARYKKYQAQGLQQQAEQYLLTEFADTSKYSSVQHYNDNTLNPCIDSTYRFVDKVLDELLALHKRAGVALKRYHIGADETAGAWQDSPACQALISRTDELHESEDLTHYFVAKVAKMVQEKGVMPAGWSDGMGKLAEDPQFTQSTPMQVNVWQTLVSQGQQTAYQFAQHNWRTILSFPDVFYFDFPYAVSGNEPGYYWASRATDSYKVFQFASNQMEAMDKLWRDRTNHPYQAKARPESADSTEFEGIQAHLWSEVVRHDSVAQYMYFPRLVSFADKAWHTPKWEQMISTQSDQWQAYMAADWRAFSHAMVKNILVQLEQNQINFRIPPAGAEIIDGKLWMNHLYPSMQLEYRDQQGDWQRYQRPVSITLPVHLRARLPNSNHLSATYTLSQ